MVRMYIRHPVNDYAVWRKGYDDLNPTRQKMGVKGDAVYRSVDDGNDVTAWHDFDTIDAARAFASSSELKDAMMSAGVAGQPSIWFVEQA